MLTSSWRIFVLLTCAVLATAGCATSSAQRDDPAEHQLAGRPPDPAEDRSYPLPRGPAILTPQAAAEDEVVEVESADVDEDAEDAEDATVASLTRADLAQLVQRGPSFLLAMVQVEPARDAEQFVGFRVAQIHPHAQGRLAGHLAAGDVITHLNGVRIKQPDDYLRAWKLLGQATSLRIDFLRANQPHHATWHVQ